MNGLDSPLEALALTPVNLGPLFAVVFNNIWAFLAVVTSAVITIWHLRPSVPKTVVTRHFTEVLHETVSQPSLISNVINEVVVEEEEEDDVVLTRGNSKKFFTVYYEEGDNEEGYYNCSDDVDDVDVEEEEVIIIKKWETETGTELTVENEMRGGELGWYEFQDRMVIDGSVVRLWDGCGKRKCSSPRGVTLPFDGYYRCTSL